MIELFSIEAEQSVIGALLHDPDSAERINGLKPEHFYHESHRIIFSQIIRMVSAGVPVDVITVADQLDVLGKSEATGGLHYLGEVTMNTPGSANINHYAKVVKDKSLERQLVAAADTIISTTKSSGSTEVKLAKAQQSVMSITESAATKSPRLVGDVLHETVEILQRRCDGDTRSIKTGFDDLDQQLDGGLQPGDLVIIAGRPSMGKTSLALNIGRNVSLSGKKVLVLSQEMSDIQLVDRLISDLGNVPLGAVRAGEMEGEYGAHIMSAVGRLRDLPLIIDDQGGLSLFDASSKSRSVRRKHGLDVLVIDYLQLMQSPGDNRNEAIGEITRGLKSLAKELDIPILLLSQLNRSLEQRGDKRPIMSDLRDSGSIEQDADVIMFVYRDEVYNEHSTDKGTAEILVRKNRQGSTGMIRLAFQGQHTRFVNLANDWRPEEKYVPFQKKRRGVD